MLLEPLPVVPAVAIFGVGHVGLELARILARHDLDLHLVDTRPEQLDRGRGWRVLADAVARVHVHHVPVLPEIVLGELPPGTHVLIMTHDHAEDARAVRRRCCARAARLDRADRLVGQVGPVPRRTWPTTATAGRGDRPDHTPIGLPELTGKEPATIAVGVAADLLRALRSGRPRAVAPRERGDGR